MYILSLSFRNFMYAKGYLRSATDTSATLRCILLSDL